MKMKMFDVCIIGGGILGCATAREIAKRNPRLSIVILEKERHLACHQSGHNSGVIHAGIYYSAGSLKAKLCVEGSSLMYQYLDSKGILYKKCGKLIVATKSEEIPLLQDLWNRGTANKVKNLKMVSANEAKQIEPRVSCLQGLWSPETGIVDYSTVTKSFAEDALNLSSSSSSCIITNFEVGRFKLQNNLRKQNKNNIPLKSQEKDGIIIIENKKKKECNDRSNEEKEVVTEVGAKFVVTAGGLWADTLSIMTGADPLPGIIPFRGEYLLLEKKSDVTTDSKESHLHSSLDKKKMKNHLLMEEQNMFRTNIYPVPDPRLPFLGMHFTPRLDGSVIIGPNAVFAFSRTGYHFGDLNLKDTLGSLSHPGFKKLVRKYFKTGLDEFVRSLSLKRQVGHVNRMIEPGLKLHEVSRGPTGVRAQALDEEGNLIEDFIFDWGREEFQGKVLHVRNAPSPAATSSLSIAKVIVDKIEEKINL